MPAVNKNQALELLAREVQKFDADELLEVYNEVFPDHPSTAEEAHEDSSSLVDQLVEHIRSGLEIDQIIDLWGVILPGDRNLWYDEEEETLHYNEEAEAVPSEERSSRRLPYRAALLSFLRGATRGQRARHGVPSLPAGHRPG